MSGPAVIVLGKGDGVARLALTKPEAASCLGMSVDSLERHVLPGVKVIRRGKLVLIPTAELAAWTEREAERTLPDAVA
ncbi:MAG: hypothetical protein U0R70_14720 [Solirubrobacteraceae bacterium]